MRHLIRFFLLLLPFLFVVWCSPSPSQSQISSWCFSSSLNECVIRYNDNVNIFPNELIMNIILAYLIPITFCHWILLESSHVLNLFFEIFKEKRNGMNGILSKFINYLPTTLTDVWQIFFLSFFLHSYFVFAFLSCYITKQIFFYFFMFFLPLNHIADTWVRFSWSKKK